MRQLQPVQTVAPAVDLIELPEARAQCRVSHSDDDEFLSGLIAAVTQYLDGPTGILRLSLLEQTWRDAWGGFPSERKLRLSAEPLIAVTTVEYVPYGETTWSTLASDQYWAFTDYLGPWVELADGASWPDTAIRPEAVRVTYTAGCGAIVSKVPKPIIHAAKLLIGHLYENREGSIIGVIPAELPLGVDALLAPWKRIPG